jgi:sec-independent protein translocase protein TatA
VIAIVPSLGWQEMFLLLVIGLLLYGRNLPEAGRTFGQFVARLKRGYQEFKDQLDRDESIREVRKTLAETTREVRDVTQVPRAIVDPASALRDLTNEAMSSPLPTRPHEGPNQQSDTTGSAR